MRAGIGTLALILHAIAWSLYAAGLVVGGMDPGASAVAMVIFAHLAAVSGMLVGVLGLLKRQQAKRCASAIVLGLVWIAYITGMFGVFAL